MKTLTFLPDESGPATLAEVHALVMLASAGRLTPAQEEAITRAELHSLAPEAADSDAVFCYRRALEDLLRARSRGEVTQEAEASLAETRAALWEKLGEAERAALEAWIAEKTALAEQAG